ncbi:MAG: bifunctional oligoribonuclease/PAP phosphatase NrnA [Flavobacteriaceae bacterium]|nr:bifunctional oligoribonuclease/PAP phosphatase NrnA [Muriicola sp.]NNC61170.1 bifunctional oligoribonuclease/PAP phosphatase NrnA [Eudoraea sp.]NNK21620.1 bifunctional oligoribonuclease/PAP phosphatase NrnA [Flavobacteriaceae bacterium]NNL40039.1 bifunctional oligoribonuclease/PAP phosphatase NrnA [Flavobacteriaceae bacterium]
MNSADVRALEALLSTPQKIAIIPHKNPDGDAIGAALGLHHYLVKKGHSSVVISPNDYPEFLKWMPGTGNVIIYEKQNAQAKELIATSTLIFTVDFNDLGRIGQMKEVLEETDTTFVMVDHHQSPANYASVMYSDTSMSSTCEMIFHMIKALGGGNEINSEIADCLYAGILTDTGSFKYAATTSETHRVVAALIDKGARNSEIHREIFDTNTPSRLHLLGCALNNLVILPEYSTAYITLSQEELDKNDFKKGDTEGFVNYGLTLAGIRMAVIFIENRDEGIIKISFRSEGDFSVNEFARSYFEGGGHTNAAGGKSTRSMKETVTYFRTLLEQHKSELNA